MTELEKYTEMLNDLGFEISQDELTELKESKDKHKTFIRIRDRHWLKEGFRL